MFQTDHLLVKFAVPRISQSSVKPGDHVQLEYNGDQKLAATVTDIIDDHNPAIDILRVVAEIDPNIPHPDDIHVGIYGHVRIADKGAAR